MGKIGTGFSTSLDGFIAGPEGEVGSLLDHLGPGPIKLERTSVVEAPGVTHLRFRILK